MNTLKKSVALILAASMTLTGIGAGSTDAAKKPKLNKKSKTMTEGEKFTIRILNADKKAKVTWKTSNKKKVKIVKKVSKGEKACAEVKALKKGKAVITAQYKAGTVKYKLQCRVIVMKEESDSDITNAANTPGSNDSKATVDPNKTVTPNVTGVPSGNVTPNVTDVPKGTDAPKETDKPGDPGNETSEATQTPKPSDPGEATQVPTPRPTDVPIAKPTATPTTKPTVAPTIKPTAKPTATPTAAAKPTDPVIARPTPPDNDPNAVKWVTTWGTAEEKNDINADRMPQLPLKNSTIRQIIKVTTGGNWIKFRLSNQYGQSDVVVNSMHIAKQVQADKSIIDTDTDTIVTVGGSESFTIPKGKVIETDATNFSVDALENVAVSMYFTSGPTSNVTGHRGARATSYQVAGNSVSAKEFTSPKTTTSWFFLADASLLSKETGRAVVCFGDSITDGYGTDAGNLGKKPDSYTRWGDYFAKRLQANESTKDVAVINEGIGANGMLGSYPTDSGKNRFLRDLTEHDGVAYCIILFGVNDLDKLQNTSKYNQLQPEYAKMVTTCHNYGIKVYAAPILPFGKSSYYSENSEKVRNMLNDWMRDTEKSGFDGIIDFESAVWDPNNHKNILEAYTHSDGLHPYDGYEAMANAIDLSMFEYDPDWVPNNPSSGSDDTLPEDKPYEFEAVTGGIALDMASYRNMSGGGGYDSTRKAVTINDKSSSDNSQGTWTLPNTIPNINQGDVVTFRVQGYNYGTSGFRFWIGSDVSGCSTPVMLVDSPDNNQLIDKSLGYPCEKDTSGNVLTPSTRNNVSNKVTCNQMAIGADKDTHAFDVTFSFKAGISQNDTNGVCSNLTLKYIFGGSTSGYIDGLVIKNIYYIPK